MAILRANSILLIWVAAFSATRVYAGIHEDNIKKGIESSRAEVCKDGCMKEQTDRQAQRVLDGQRICHQFTEQLGRLRGDRAKCTKIKMLSKNDRELMASFNETGPIGFGGPKNICSKDTFWKKPSLSRNQAVRECAKQIGHLRTCYNGLADFERDHCGPAR